MPKYKRRSPRKTKSRVPTRRRNPVVTVDPTDIDFTSDVPKVIGHYGMPSEPTQAFELGRLVGLRRGMELCGIQNIYKRYKISKKLRAEMDQWLKNLALQSEAISRGIQGATIPTVRIAGEGGIPRKKR